MPHTISLKKLDAENFAVGNENPLSRETYWTSVLHIDTITQWSPSVYKLYGILNKMKVDEVKDLEIKIVPLED